MEQAPLVTVLSVDIVSDKQEGQHLIVVEVEVEVVLDGGSEMESRDLRCFRFQSGSAIRQCCGADLGPCLGTGSWSPGLS